MLTKEEIIEGNKLIAEFLGWELNSIGYYGYYRQFDKYLYNPITGNDKSFQPEQLAFHVSWDWVMQVVEKINNFKKGGIQETYRDSNGTCATASTWFGPSVSYYYSNHEQIISEYAKMHKLAARHKEEFDEGNQRIAESKIEAVFLCCIFYIKWYNQQPK